jgi:hypothetical protein
MGDIDPRIDQRRSILDAICAASHRVVVTCNGRSIKNNAEVPLITPLAELLDLCERCGVEEDQKNKGFLQVEYQHPRHFSSPLNFIKGKIVPGMVWSHDDVALRSITEEHSKTQAAIEADIAVARMAEVPRESSYRVISPREFESFMRDPLTAFVRSGLGINTWNNEEDDEPATIPLELTQKEVGQLRGNLASAVQSGFTASHWTKVNTAVGNIPMGAYGSQLAEEIIGRVDELSHVASDWGIHLDELIPYEIRIPYAGGEVAGNLMVFPAAENHIAIVDLGKTSGNKVKELQASMGLKLLLLHAMGYEVDGGLVVVIDGKGIDAKVVWHYVQLDPNMTSDAARNRVADISQLFEVAVRSPYPMFGKTAELVNNGETDKGRKAFDAVVGLDLQLEDGSDYGYLQKQECLVFGLTPKFEELFAESSEITNFFNTFFETIVKQSDELKKELKLGNRKDPAGSASRKRYLYA